MKNYQEMTRDELMRELGALQTSAPTGANGGQDQSQAAVDDQQRLLHELQVQQVELEAQNRELRETRQELEESRSRYVELYDFAPYGHLTFDDKGRILEINLTGARMLSKARTYLIGKPFVTYLAKGESKRFLEHVRRCQRGEEKVMTELTLSGDGARRAQLLSIPPPNGVRQRESFGAALIDVTERQRAEEAKRESEDRMVGIINSAMDAVISVDEGQRVILFNAAAERMFGYSAAEMIGQPISRLIPERFRASHEGHIRRFTVTGETTRAMGALGAVSGLRRDGNEFPIEASISQLEAGGQKLFTVILRDITARKQTEERLIEQAALLDQSHEAIVVHDLDNRIQYWSRGAERLYGWMAEEAVGRPVQELTYRESLSQLTEATRIVIEKSKWNGELRHLTKDGREVIVEGYWTLVRDTEGNPQTILAINTDITEKKRLEAQFLRAQRLESIGTLASGIAHDLNNILSPITMGAQMLQMKQQDEQSQRLLEVMRTSAERGAEMIKQVLSFAKGIGGERVTIQPKHLIREIVRVAEETFPKSLRITQRVTEELWVTSGDPTQLQQVLMNLCVNARDAMPNGGALTIEAENRTLDEIYAGMLHGARAGNFVLITVTDTGTGIPPEIIDRIFDPFFTTKEPGQGAGLGLATVQGIVANHSGFITVESQPGLGTKFKIHLPAQEAASLKQVDEEYPDSPSGNGELILVIDDEAAVREMTGTTLETFGYRVMTADNGATALGVFAGHQDEVSVVITDMMMPLMDGPMTIRALRKLNPQVCIIASSGLSESIDAADLDQLGVKTFLIKPYGAKTLLKTVAQALSQSRHKSA